MLKDVRNPDTFCTRNCKKLFMKKCYVTSFLLLLFSFSANAQDWLGVDNMNYGGLNTLDLNPANIADNRLKVDVMLGGVTLGAYNNYFGISRAAATDTVLQQDPDFLDKYVEWNDNGEDKSLYFNNRIYLPSFMFGIKENMGAGFTWQIRTMVNIDGVSQDLATLLRENLEYTDLWNLNLQNDQLSAQFNSWAEYGLNFGMVAMDKNEHFLKWGTRVKLLQGLGSAYGYMDRLQYNFTNDDTLSVFSTEVDYGHSSNFEYNDSTGTEGTLKYKLVSNLGVGFDIGAIYEWRPKHADYKYDMDGREDLWRRDKNKYKLRVGLSITDIGRIKYDKGEFSNSFVADIDSLPIDTIGDIVNNVESWDQWLDTFQTSSNDERTYNMTLPTTISLQVDYHIHKDFYVNFTPYFAFQNAPKQQQNDDVLQLLTHPSVGPQVVWSCCANVDQLHGRIPGRSRTSLGTTHHRNREPECRLQRQSTARTRLLRCSQSANPLPSS